MDRYVAVLTINYSAETYLDALLVAAAARRALPMIPAIPEFGVQIASIETEDQFLEALNVHA